tara:strand:+ start:29 stop:271 length:243 start_codon:yes stop_codon:yes gene_type:complete
MRKEVIMKMAKLTAEQIVEMLARMSDAEKQKTANLMVNKWFHLTKSFVSMVDAEMQDQFMNEQAEIFEMQKAAENGTKLF